MLLRDPVYLHFVLSNIKQTFLIHLNDLVHPTNYLSNHVSFCLSYKHYSPLLTRKADFINELKLRHREFPNKNRTVGWR